MSGQALREVDTFHIKGLQREIAVAASKILKLEFLDLYAGFLLKHSLNYSQTNSQALQNPFRVIINPS